jgi:hypothetical protein
MTSSPIREFALKALLWLPLSFFVWFRFASPLAWVPIRLARAALLAGWPTLFADVAQGADVIGAGGRVLGHSGYLMQLSTRVLVRVPAGPDGPGGVGALEPTVNPMIYGYALPLFVGLVMATPLPAARRWLQLAIGLAAIWIAQAFGAVAESLKIVAFDAGDAGSAAAAQAGVHPAAVALAYQFGYLILPAILPVFLWIGLNRGFITVLTGRPGEPGSGPRGP